MLEIAGGIIVALIVLAVIWANLRNIILVFLSLIPPTLGAIVGAIVATMKSPDNLLLGAVIGGLIGLGIVFMGLTDNSLEEERNAED